DELEVPAELGQDARLDPAARADELDLRVGLARAELLRERDAGEQVSARAAAGDQEACHVAAVDMTRTRTRFLRAAASRAAASRAVLRSGRRPTLSSSPTRNIVITSELPP